MAFGTGGGSPQNDRQFGQKHDHNPFASSTPQGRSFGEQPPSGNPFGGPAGLPTPPGGPPPSGGKKKRRPVLITVIAVVLVAVVAAVTFVVTRPASETVSPQTSATPTARESINLADLPRLEPPMPTVDLPKVDTPTAEPGNSDREPLEPIPRDEVVPGRELLTDNPLYDIEIPDKPCDAELVPFSTDLDAERERLKPFYDCVVALHQPALEQVSQPDTQPPAPPSQLQTYMDPATGACGDIPEVYTGLYCSADGYTGVDIGWAANDTDPTNRPSFGYAYQILFHEYGHHLQHRTGVFLEFHNRPYNSDEENLRRSELQAECFASIATARLGYADPEWRAAWERAYQDPINDSPTHGSAASRGYWTHRGWNARTYGDCNTWAAPARLVT